MESEIFVANECVAVCYALVCAIPGENLEQIDDGTMSRQFWQPIAWDGLGVITPDYQVHGNCGLHTSSFNKDKGIGYEHNEDGTIKTETTIYDVNLGSEKEPGMYFATWHSNNGTDYTHYGYAILDDRPNFS